MKANKKKKLSTKLDIYRKFRCIVFSRMSPTEFSNYIKQRAIQQQQLHHNNHNGQNNLNSTNGSSSNGHINPIGPVSPARSLSPNPLSIAIMNGSSNGSNNMSTRTRSSYGSNGTAGAGTGAGVGGVGGGGVSSGVNGGGISSSVNGAAGHNNFDNHTFDSHSYLNSSMYSPPYGRNALYDSSNPFGGGSPSIPTTTNTMANSSSFYSNGWNSTIGSGANNKYSPYIDTNNYYGLSSSQQAPTQQQQQQAANAANGIGTIGSTTSHINGMTNGHHQTLETNLNVGNINLLVAN